MDLLHKKMQEDAQNYFGDNPVKFHVKIDKRI